MPKTISARYPGKCASTGREYPAGTLIVKGAKGYQIAEGAHVAEFRPVQMSDWDTPRTIDVAQILFCNCAKLKPGFDPSKPAEQQFPECVFVRSADTLSCKECGRTGVILPKRPPVVEKRQCWECGCEFTYAECKRNGGDWNENGGYCGC